MEEEEKPSDAEASQPNEPTEGDVDEAGAAEAAAGEEETVETVGAAGGPVAEAADEPTAVTVEEPTAVRAVGDRRVRAGVGAVSAALAVGAGGYAIGQSSSSDLSFDGSPVAYLAHRGDSDDRLPGGFADDLMRGHWRGDGDCPDR